MTQASILIVDDVPANLSLLTGMLKEHGYKVRPAPGGSIALDAARHTPPDLILLDIHMPDMDGFEVCKRLKADERLKEIPVLFISALTETKDKIEAFNAGGTDYITKPFQAEEVLARVKIHLELRRYRMELQKQNEILKDTITQLKNAQSRLIQSEKMAALGVLSAGIAHEINNPVNFIKTSVHALQRNIDDILKFTDYCVSLCRTRIGESVSKEIAEFQESVGYEAAVAELPVLSINILEGIRRTEEIVKSLRTFARQDSAKTELADIHEIMDSALVMLRNRYKKTITVVRNYGEVPLIPCYSGKLTQVMINLVGNAIDAIEERGSDARRREITISTSIHDRQYAAVRISDTGTGIPENIFHRIFDPFFTTKEVGKGTGLGLFISRNIIQEHQGMIEVSSQIGVGTTVSVLLPLKGEL